MFHDMIVDMESNKRFSLIVTELVLRGRKLNISLGFSFKNFYERTILISVNNSTVSSDNPLRFRKNLL